MILHPLLLGLLIMPKSLIPHSLLWLLFPYALSFIPPCGLRGLLTQAPERESDWLPHHTELSTDWLTAIGSGGPLDQSALPSGAGHVVQRLPQTSWSVGVDGLIPDLPAAEASGEGLGKEVWPFVIGPLRFGSVTSWAWQMFKVTRFLQGAFVGSRKHPSGANCPSLHKASHLLHLVANVSLGSLGCLGTMCVWNPGQDL